MRFQKKISKRNQLNQFCVDFKNRYTTHEVQQYLLVVSLLKLYYHVKVKTITNNSCRRSQRALVDNIFNKFSDIVFFSSFMFQMQKSKYSYNLQYSNVYTYKRFTSHGGYICILYIRSPFIVGRHSAFGMILIMYCIRPTLNNGDDIFLRVYYFVWTSGVGFSQSLS